LRAAWYKAPSRLVDVVEVLEVVLLVDVVDEVVLDIDVVMDIDVVVLDEELLLDDEVLDEKLVNATAPMAIITTTTTTATTAMVETPRLVRMRVRRPRFDIRVHLDLF